KDPQRVSQQVAGFCRDLVLAKTAPQRRDLVTLTEPTWLALVEQAHRWPLPTLLNMQQHLRQAESLIRHSHQPRLWLEITLLELLARDPQIPPASSVTGTLPIPAAPAQPTPEPVVPRQVSLSSQWEEFLACLGPLAKARFHLGTIVAEGAGKVTIAFPTPGFADKARQSLKEAQSVAKKMLGLGVQFELVSQTPAPTPPAPVPVPVPQPRQTGDDTVEVAAAQVAEFFGGAVLDIDDPEELPF
ncbi:MAG: hypothetical protein Q6K70_02945, partial [Thermostichales cyanobacterium DRC_bins_46]